MPPEVALSPMLTSSDDGAGASAGPVAVACQYASPTPSAPGRSSSCPASAPSASVIVNATPDASASAAAWRPAARAARMVGTRCGSFADTSVTWKRRRSKLCAAAGPCGRAALGVRDVRGSTRSTRAGKPIKTVKTLRSPPAVPPPGGRASPPAVRAAGLCEPSTKSRANAARSIGRSHSDTRDHRKSRDTRYESTRGSFFTAVFYYSCCVCSLLQTNIRQTVRFHGSR
jgi:hypothetical protein